MVGRILDCFFGRKLKHKIRRHVREVACATALTSRRNADEVLDRMRSMPGPKVALGTTDWGGLLEVPLSELLDEHALMMSRSGGGKTRLALRKINRVIEESERCNAGFMAADGAKTELFLGITYLLKRRLEFLSKHDPAAAAKLRRRIKFIDFGSPSVVTPFSFIARPPDTDPDIHAAQQVDILLDSLPEGLTLATPAFKSLVQLYSQPELDSSIIELIRALDDESLLERALIQSPDRALAATVRRQLGSLSRSTKAALRRRLEVLDSSKIVSRMLAGKTAPDFRRYQDEGCFVLVNCAGPNIPRSLTRFLNTLVISKFCRSISARQNPGLPFQVFADESHDLFSSSIISDHLSDAGRLSRSSGTHFVFMAQSEGAAIPDPRTRRLLNANVGWVWSGPGDPEDNRILEWVLPATGRRPRPKQSPYEETTFYSVAEERKLLLQEMANLPKRTGYFWLKGKMPEAIRIRTCDLDIPQGRELLDATDAIRRDPTIGARQSRKEFERMMAEQDRKRRGEEGGDLPAKLQQAYRAARGTEA